MNIYLFIHSDRIGSSLTKEPLPVSSMEPLGLGLSGAGNSALAEAEEVGPPTERLAPPPPPLMVGGSSGTGGWLSFGCAAWAALALVAAADSCCSRLSSSNASFTWKSCSLQVSSSYS